MNQLIDSEIKYFSTLVKQEGQEDLVHSEHYPLIIHIIVNFLF